MSFVIAMFGSKIAGALAALATFCAAIIGIRWDAKRDERRRAELEALKAARKQQEAVNDAVESSHAGGAAWAERLRKDTD